VIDEIFLVQPRRTARTTLFFHGFTASPLQFAALARDVYAMGDNVYVPRLPRHGHSDRLTEALRDLSARELRTHAEDSLRIAAGIGSSVRVVGFSLGGLLAAWIAQRYDIEQAVAISPMLGIAGVPPRLTSALATTLLKLPNTFVWWDPVQRAHRLPLHGYPRFPTHAVAQSLLIAKEVIERAATRHSRSPIVFVTNAGESTVSNRAVAELTRLWKADSARCVEQQCITGLGLSHDIIEPSGPRTSVEKSYSVIKALLERSIR
jgi:alpha-beta hydrolase superfamily lysophospholipase